MEDLDDDDGVLATDSGWISESDDEFTCTMEDKDEETMDTLMLEEGSNFPYFDAAHIGNLETTGLSCERKRKWRRKEKARKKHRQRETKLREIQRQAFFKLGCLLTAHDSHKGLRKIDILLKAVECIKELRREERTLHQTKVALETKKQSLEARMLRLWSSHDVGSGWREVGWSSHDVGSGWREVGRRHGQDGKGQAWVPHDGSSMEGSDDDESFLKTDSGWISESDDEIICMTEDRDEETIVEDLMEASNFLQLHNPHLSNPETTVFSSQREQAHKKSKREMNEKRTWKQAEKKQRDYNRQCQDELYCVLNECGRAPKNVQTRHILDSAVQCIQDLETQQKHLKECLKKEIQRSLSLLRLGFQGRSKKALMGSSLIGLEADDERGEDENEEGGWISDSEDEAVIVKEVKGEGDEEDEGVKLVSSGPDHAVHTRDAIPSIATAPNISRNVAIATVKMTAKSGVGSKDTRELTRSCHVELDPPTVSTSSSSSDKSVEKSENSSKIPCLLCSQVFDSIEGLSRHLPTHIHGMSNSDESSSRVTVEDGSKSCTGNASMISSGLPVSNASGRGMTSPCSKRSHEVSRQEGNCDQNPASKREDTSVSQKISNFDKMCPTHGKNSNISQQKCNLNERHAVIQRENIPVNKKKCVVGKNPGRNSSRSQQKAKLGESTQTPRGSSSERQPESDLDERLKRPTCSLVLSCTICNYNCHEYLKTTEKGRAFEFPEFYKTASDLIDELQKRFPFICNLCQISTSGQMIQSTQMRLVMDWQNCLQEMLTRIPRHTHLPFCQYCKKSFTTFSLLQCHTKREHCKDLTCESIEIRTEDIFCCRKCLNKMYSLAEHSSPQTSEPASMHFQSVPKKKVCHSNESLLHDTLQKGQVEGPILAERENDVAIEHTNIQGSQSVNMNVQISKPVCSNVQQFLDRGICHSRDSLLHNMLWNCPVELRALAQQVHNIHNQCTNNKCVDSIVQSSQSVGSNVQSSQSVGSNVQSSQSVGSNVQSSQPVGLNVHSSQSIGLNVQSSQPVGLSVQSSSVGSIVQSSSVGSNVKSSQHVSLNVQGSQSVALSVQSSSVGSNVQSSSVGSNVKSSQHVSSNVQGSQPNGCFLENGQVEGPTCVQKKKHTAQQQNPYKVYQPEKAQQPESSLCFEKKVTKPPSGTQCNHDFRCKICGFSWNHFTDWRLHITIAHHVYAQQLGLTLHTSPSFFPFEMRKKCFYIIDCGKCGSPFMSPDSAMLPLQFQKDRTRYFCTLCRLKMKNHWQCTKHLQDSHPGFGQFVEQNHAVEEAKFVLHFVDSVIFSCILKAKPTCSRKSSHSAPGEKSVYVPEKCNDSPPLPPVYNREVAQEDAGISEPMGASSQLLRFVHQVEESKVENMKSQKSNALLPTSNPESSQDHRHEPCTTQERETRGSSGAVIASALTESDPCQTSNSEPLSPLQSIESNLISEQYVFLPVYNETEAEGVIRSSDPVTACASQKGFQCPREKMENASSPQGPVDKQLHISEKRNDLPPLRTVDNQTEAPDLTCPSELINASAQNQLAKPQAEKSMVETIESQQSDVPLSTSHLTGSFVCHLCMFGTGGFRALKNHVHKFHFGMTCSYKCRSCDTLFDRPEDFIKHSKLFQ